VSAVDAVFGTAFARAKRDAIGVGRGFSFS
jgi:hypothetical protein